MKIKIEISFFYKMFPITIFKRMISTIPSREVSLVNNLFKIHSENEFYNKMTIAYMMNEVVDDEKLYEKELAKLKKKDE